MRFLSHHGLAGGCFLVALLLLASVGCQSSAVPAGGTANAQETVNKKKTSTDQKQKTNQKSGQKTKETQQKAGNQGAANQAIRQADHPFPRRIEMPEFPEKLPWLNTKPLKLADLRGKFVILDFWTYCCINCMHILPELKKIEESHANQVVVIGVHSPKFSTEKETDNVADAIMRYDIEHPVVNDAEQRYWNTLGIDSWPTLLLIDPEGQAVAIWRGEIEAQDIQSVLDLAIPYYREQQLLDEKPLRFELLEYQSTRTPLRYPGKILADEQGGRLFIADSNHHRIVVASLEGKLLEIIGSGKSGRNDGSYAEATFNQPQGMALHEETLYIADTENHLLRKVDLQKKSVTTIAGTGTQGRNAWPGFDPQLGFGALPERFVGKPKTTGLNSPWDLWVHDKSLYIAMAGPHQIWRMPLDESEIGPYAGNGREDIVDGPLLPSQPYAPDASSFAQPSGLTSDGQWLYVADSEGSSIRAVPFDPADNVRTVVGTAHMPYGQRLFTFGDQDGDALDARLQHCLAVTYHDAKLYVADTYNNKIKVVDPQTGDTQTFVGTGKPGTANDPAEFDEPAGLAYAAGKLYVADTNNHLIRTIDLQTKQVATLEIQGLEPIDSSEPPKKPSFERADQIEMPPGKARVVDGKVRLHVNLQLPEGWKINELAPIEYWLEAASAEGPISRTSLGAASVDPPAAEFDIEVPATGTGAEQLELSLIYYYCQTSGAICKVGSAVVKIPVEIANEGDESIAAVIPIKP